MATKRTIKVTEIVGDIRLGIPNTALMAKYGLSRKQLYDVFDQLVTAKVISPSDLRDETALSLDSGHVLVLPREGRDFPRIELDFELSIHDAKRPDLIGLVEDVSERGMRIRGIETRVGEVKTFAVPAGKYEQISPFAFEAVCRWVERKPNGEAWLDTGSRTSLN